MEGEAVKVMVSITKLEADLHFAIQKAETGQFLI